MLSTFVSITLPSYLDQVSLISSIASSSHIATNDDPVPDKPEAIAPTSKASIAILESKLKVFA